MEPESGNVGSQDAADVPSQLPSSEKNKDVVNPSNPVNSGEAENPSGPSYVEEAENYAGKSNKGHQSQKKAPGKLRARSKAFKKSSANKSLEAKNAKATPQSKGRFRKVTMEPVSDNVGSHDAADVPTHLPSSEKNKDTMNPSNPVNGGEAENPSGPSYAEEAENSAGKSNKGQQSQKRAPGKLTARSMAFKKSSANKSLEAKNAKAAPQSKGGFRKGNKTPLQSNNKVSNKIEHVDLKKTPAEEKTGKNQANGGFRKGNKAPLHWFKESNKTEHVDLKETPGEENTGKNQANGGFRKGNKAPLHWFKESNKTEHVDLKETPGEENTGKNHANGGFRKGNKAPSHWFKESNKTKHVDLKETPTEENTGMNHKEERHVEEGKKIQTNDDTHGTRKRHQKRRHENKSERSEGTSKNQIDKKKSYGKEKRRQDEGEKGKLGGLIFMCNAKTKPDCFHYRVMGVSMPKKDLVLSVKHGLKLFLYDFDLRLMYGIYEASSSGGLKLEPKAFRGSFPVQVRFSIYKDCFPLSESVFKKAIKDNYFEKNKFRPELTVRQVQKLSQLFRPVVSQPLQAVPVHPSAIGSVWDRERYRGVRDSGRHLEREALPISTIDGRGHPLLSSEMDRHTEHRDPQRQEMPRNLYMSEREYRTYGLLGERRSLSASQNIESASDPYIKDRERHALLRQQDAEYREAEYRDSVAARREVVADPLYMTHREALINDLHVLRGAPDTGAHMLTTTTESYMHDRDPFHAYRYGASSVDTYLPPPGREEVPASSYYADNRRDGKHPDTDLLRRMENDRLDQLYRKYAVDAPPSNYNQLPRYTEIQHVPVPSSVHRELVSTTVQQETLPTSVSSRYSFAGPSLSFR